MSVSDIKSDFAHMRLKPEVQTLAADKTISGPASDWILPGLLVVANHQMIAHEEIGQRKEHQQHVIKPSIDEN